MAQPPTRLDMHEMRPGSTKSETARGPSLFRASGPHRVPTRRRDDPLHQEIVICRSARDVQPVAVQVGRLGPDLHAVRDRCMIEQGCLVTPYSIAPDLLEDVAEDDRGHGERPGRTTGRTSRSRSRSARRPNTASAPETGCWYAAATQRLEQGEPEKTVVIDRSLIEINLPTLRDRLAKARVRLGGLLNQVVGKVSAPRRRLLGPLPAQPLGHAYALRRYRG